MNNTIKWSIVGVAIAALIYAGFVGYDLFSKPKPVGSESVEVTAPAPAVKRAPKVKVAIKAPVTTYQGESKANLKLPADVQADEHKQVIAAQQTPANLRPTTQTTVIDTDTGEVKTYVKTDPYPWIAYEPRGSIGLAYGYKYNHVLHNSASVARLEVGYDVVRIKALTVGVRATVDSDSTAFAGVGVKYQW